MLSLNFLYCPGLYHHNPSMRFLYDFPMIPQSRTYRSCQLHGNSWSHRPADNEWERRQGPVGHNSTCFQYNTNSYAIAKCPILLGNYHKFQVTSKEHQTTVYFDVVVYQPFCHSTDKWWWEIGVKAVEECSGDETTSKCCRYILNAVLIQLNRNRSMPTLVLYRFVSSTRYTFNK